ncbi:MAG TPA: hypothetical protein VNM90_21230 [Haliangium sp.]|nr:hypothetical protein [Haliangium sp.]
MRTRRCPVPAPAHLAMLVAALASLASCGKVRLDPLDDAPDGAVSADAAAPHDSGGGLVDARSPTDPADARAACVWTAFEPPARLFGIPDDDDWLGSVSDDGNTVVVDRYFSTLNDLFIARRAAINEPFGDAVAVDELNTPARDATGTLLAGGLEIYFSSDRAPTTSSGLWWASRATADGVFDTPVQIAELNAGGDLTEHALTPDGLAVYFTSTRAGSAFGGRNIWFAERPDRDQPFSAPRPLDELNSDANDRAPGISADGLEIFVSSERAGGSGALDLWRATRASLDKPFGPPESVVELNTSNDETYPRLSADGSVLYFNYDTNIAGNLNADVWEARRKCIAVAP